RRLMFALRQKNKATVSLYEEVGTDKDGNTLQIIDVLTEEEDSAFEKADNELTSMAIRKKMAETLSKREYTVVALRYGIGNGECYAQREVAKMLKISRSYVSRIEKKALEKLRTVIKKEDFFI
ncbi:MAG: sigma-70 family RNA polymerase sigma factor, partial [Clostridia bacterium]|nr:sigma-70 family RNA polymerase sigma factor [Clostridia bacterium]